MRKLATVRRIRDIKDIVGADKIQLASVDGWSVVVRKGEFKVGELVIYFEIDSWVPHDVAPFLSNPNQENFYEGVRGNRLKTKKLRGETSQGLILPLNHALKMEFYHASTPNRMPIEDDDFTEILGILKWEPEIPEEMKKIAVGAVPWFVPSTSLERIQNIRDESIFEETYEVTEKLDGMALAIMETEDGNLRIFSRGWELKYSEDSIFARGAKTVEKNMIGTHGYVVQGELVGPGIAKNKYKLDELRFYVYKIYDIKKRQYVSPEIRRQMCKIKKFLQVPVVDGSFLVDQWVDPKDAILKMADGKSEINSKVLREGLVFQSWNSDKEFKAISNNFLVKHDE